MKLLTDRKLSQFAMKLNFRHGKLNDYEIPIGATSDDIRLKLPMALTNP
jgi:hypothetical protein